MLMVTEWFQVSWEPAHKEFSMHLWWKPFDEPAMPGLEMNNFTVIMFWCHSDFYGLLSVALWVSFRYVTSIEAKLVLWPAGPPSTNAVCLRKILAENRVRWRSEHCGEGLPSISSFLTVIKTVEDFSIIVAIVIRGTVIHWMFMVPSTV